MRKRKLVRDKVPGLGNSGEYFTNPRFYKADAGEFRAALGDKLVEESGEVREAVHTFNCSPTAYNKAKVLEELADLFQVFSEFGEAFDLAGDELETAAKNKHEERGGFDDRTIVEYDG